MNLADEFVVYDSVQYTKNDWRNRNTLPTKSGLTWLTIPVSTSGKSSQRINEATISDRRWARKHWMTVEQILGRYEHFERFREVWHGWYTESAELTSLHDVNVIFLRGIAVQLGIDTLLRDDREFVFTDDTPTGKLVQLCQQTGADRYLTGPSALSYLEINRFHEANIEVEVIDYGSYPTYLQSGGHFHHGVSVLDLLAALGPAARTHLIGTTFCPTSQTSERRTS